MWTIDLTTNISVDTKTINKQQFSAFEEKLVNTNNLFRCSLKVSKTAYFHHVKYKATNNLVIKYPS